ncbi:MAG: hypothetical protein IT305_28595 [Chloroflexi bacterium]|nr:hypothetical protein [Chloroflexota bacterium]
MRRRAWGTLVLACWLLGQSALAAADPLGADQRYEGTQEAGGPVTLVVAGEPAQVVQFEVEGVAGGSCSWDTIRLDNWGGPLPISDDRFSATNADGDILEGVWVSHEPNSTRIEGVITVRDPVRGCETPPLRWVATLTP